MEDQRERLRLSLQPALFQELDELAAAFKVDRNSFATLALSMGMRLFKTLNPSPSDQEVMKMASNRAMLELAGAFNDSGLRPEQLKK